MDEDQRKSFDEKCLDGMMAKAKELLSEHPETRGCIVIWDYKKGINQSGVKSGFWITESGAPTTPAEMFGGLGQALNMMENMFIALVGSYQGLVEDATMRVEALTSTNKEIEERQRELAELEARCKSLEQKIQQKEPPRNETQEPNQAEQEEEAYESYLDGSEPTEAS